jgi:hypothetical protein
MRHVFGSVGALPECLLGLQLSTHDARTLQCCCDRIRPGIRNSGARPSIDDRAARAGR